MAKYPTDQLLVTKCALEAGFAISTAHGQSKCKLMPISDLATLREFASLVVEAVEEAEKD